jgi:hypothetical protein
VGKSGSGRTGKAAACGDRWKQRSDAVSLFNHFGSQIIFQFIFGFRLGRSKYFATRGILICARYFLSRGHQVMTFVPEYRRRQSQDNFRKPMKDQHLLNWMYRKGFLNYTPCRTVETQEHRRRIICYDDL